MEIRLGARIDDVEARLSARIDRLETRIVVADQNSVARQQNGLLVTTKEFPLEALHSVLTGSPIPDFPAQLADIDQLTGAQADIILRELGVSMQAGVLEKRKRIRAFCSVRGV
ncbi:hypothetical protein B0T26DRAFT_735615 [Lasiosphaeria miniovina]|uniref:Uncharacterized protein n=1 Tax=Lasiosphaeria miniovina TaxID=1954250 RepID=A0AA40DHZ9_9PEZI|nr:uncharacterized protein B0T26DRAFT_735615 [Lasiosphaeria miniovina]KAK0702036.1 hypothetical protein B0T26DRAFT_735615 [Lasiosphaeria miniovina]